MRRGTVDGEPVETGAGSAVAVLPDDGTDRVTQLQAADRAGDTATFIDRSGYPLPRCHADATVETHG